ncbi:MAG: Gfo/Idh/MocA family oxidoreductase, partial [Phycisphaerae bacterium]|nr:Gfo/Idh/MocA family oxidoreductase [Phycisphaerae bacterium]
MNEPRICVVGTGALATRRITPYIGTAGGRLVGLCDLEREKAELNARRYGGNVYTDMETMLDAEKPDGVMIAIGPTPNARLATQVMKRGIAVYTEKPPAGTAADALDVARVSAETGVLCTTAFKKRYNTAYSRAKEWIEKFDEADRYSIGIDYCSGQFSNDTERMFFLLAFGIHIIDLVGYLFGDAADVFAFSKGVDAYAVSMRFASGAV